MRRTIGLVLLACALTVAACGGGSDKSGGNGARDLTKVTVGALPIAPLAPLYLGIDKGFFRDEGLDVVTQSTQSGAALLPAVVSGQFQFGYSNFASLILANAKGLDLKMLANGGNEEPAKPYSFVLSAKDSSIRKPADLAGKTIAVNAINTIGDVTVKAALERKGVDISNTKFIEVGFPDMQTALETGRADAVWVVPPFVKPALAAGSHKVLANYRTIKPAFQVSAYFTSAKYAKENPDVVNRFDRALFKSAEYANNHPNEVRREITTFTKIPKQVANEMLLPDLTPALRTADVRLMAELMAKQGLLKSAPGDAGSMVWPAPSPSGGA